MGEIIQSELNCTLRRIKASLNKRYETDADLYISYQDTVDIKKHLFSKNFDAIENMMSAGIVSRVVISRVVVKNLWLIDNLNKEESKRLNFIINSCDAGTLATIAQDIEDNEIEISPQYKGDLIKLYYSKCPPEKCIEYLNRSQEMHMDNNVLRLCLIRAVKNETDANKKVDLIQHYLSEHTVLANDTHLLVGLGDNISDEEEKNIYQDRIVKIVTDCFENGEEVPKTYENAVFSFKDSDEITSICDLYLGSRGYYSDDLKQKFSVIGVFLRDYLRQLTEENDISNGISSIIDLYNDTRNILAKNIIKNKVFQYKGYSEPITKELQKQLEDEDIEIAEKQSFDKVHSAEDIMSFITNNKYNGPKWAGFAAYACLFKIKRNAGQVIIDFLKKYGNPNKEIPSTPTYEPMYMEYLLTELFQVYAERVYETEPAIDALLTFFHELRDGLHDNDTDWDVQQNKTFIMTIGSNMVDELVKRRIKSGGVGGALYNYLYDFRREDCKKVFDI